MEKERRFVIQLCEKSQIIHISLQKSVILLKILNPSYHVKYAFKWEKDSICDHSYLSKYTFKLKKDINLRSLVFYIC